VVGGNVVSLAVGAFGAAAVVGWWLLGGTVWLIPWAVMASLLALVDFAKGVIPTPAARSATVITVVLLVAACRQTGHWGQIWRGGACAAVAWAVFAAWAVISPRSLGFGDARMVCLVALGAGAVSPAGTFVAVSCSLMAGASWGKMRPRMVGGRLLAKHSWRAGSLAAEEVGEQKAVALGPLLALSGIVVAVTNAF
jgi:hypothetical protein